MKTTSASQAHILWHVALADFLERVRRYSFLITLLVTGYFGYLAAIGKITLSVGGTRGVYNSAWIGALMTLVATTFLSLAGFYVVKNTVERDRETRVGQILASTPISKFMYLIGKWLSNFMVLGLIVAILAISGIIMQFWQGEDPHVQLWKFLSPFLLLALPAMALVAALAVVFETISWLRGGFGNVFYYFVWNAGLVMAVIAGENSAGNLYDWVGLGLVWKSMKGAAPGASNSFSFNAGTARTVNAAFLWNGIGWTGGMILSRLAWIGFSLVLVAASALLFDRFDPAGRKLLETGGKAAPENMIEGVRSGVWQPAVALTPLRAAPTQFRFGAMLAAELRLMLKGQKWWWYAGAALLLALCVGLPAAKARGIALCVAWIWPVLLWSAMGVREKRDQTSQLLFSAPHPIARQLPAVWCAGVVLAAITGSGFALRLVMGEDWRGLVAWMAGAIFIPTLALTLGVWSGTSKLFEIVYTVLWYVGPMHANVRLDFMGSLRETAMTRVPIFYLALAAAMAILAVAGRKRQLQN